MSILRYAKLAHLVQQLVAKVRLLSYDSDIKTKVAKELLTFLHGLGVVEGTVSLEGCEKISVSAFCKRRLPHVLIKLKMAKHMNHAISLIEHGHIRIGMDLVTDPARLVTRDMEDLVTWSEGSKYKRAIQEFKDEQDDYDMLS